jgi:hypothetical protein
MVLSCATGDVQLIDSSGTVVKADHFNVGPAGAFLGFVQPNGSLGVIAGDGTALFRSTSGDVDEAHVLPPGASIVTGSATRPTNDNQILIGFSFSPENGDQNGFVRLDLESLHADVVIDYPAVYSAVPRRDGDGFYVLHSTGQLDAVLPGRSDELATLSYDATRGEAFMALVQ